MLYSRPRWQRDEDHASPSARSRGEAASAGAVLRVIRDAGTLTRAELVRRTGLARSTVAQRVDTLMQHGLIHETGGGDSTGGRPPTALAFDDSSGVVLCADLGVTHARLAVCDLGGAPLAEEVEDLDIAAGPDAVLATVHERFGALLAAAGRSESHVRGIGLGVPGPVAFDRGKPTNPPIMPGWDGFSIPGWFASTHRRAGARRQRREHHGARRALDHVARPRSPALHQGRNGHRLRHRRQGPDPSRSEGRRRRHRPHPPRRPGRHVPLRERRLPRGRLRRRGARAAAVRAGDRGAHQPRRRAPS